MTCKQVTAEKMLRISPEFAVWVKWVNKKGYPIGYPFLFKRETGIEYEHTRKTLIERSFPAPLLIVDSSADSKSWFWYDAGR